MMGRAIGLDPGVNFGLTVILDGEVLIMNGKLPSLKDRQLKALEAIEFVKELPQWPLIVTAFVEDAAFGKQFGQTGLAEVRFGFWYGFHMRHLPELRTIPPMSWRKIAFGKGTITGGDVWPLLNPNAADSLGIALAALKGR